MLTPLLKKKSRKEIQPTVEIEEAPNLELLVTVAATEELRSKLLSEVEERLCKGRRESKNQCFKELDQLKILLQKTREQNSWAEGIDKPMEHLTTLLWIEGGGWVERWGDGIFLIKKETQRLKNQRTFNEESVTKSGRYWEVTSQLMRTSAKNEMKRPITKIMTRWMPPLDRGTGERPPQQELVPKDLTRWGDFIRALRELILDLRMMFPPNDQPRDWEQIARSERTILLLESMINTAELVGRLVGDPGKIMDRLMDELRKLQEGWERPCVERIRIIMAKARLQWGSIELQN
jgi:hypothetical protein